MEQVEVEEFERVMQECTPTRPDLHTVISEAANLSTLAEGFRLGIEAQGRQFFISLLIEER